MSGLSVNRTLPAVEAPRTAPTAPASQTPAAPPAAAPAATPAPSTNSTITFNLEDFKSATTSPNSFNFNLTRDPNDFSRTDPNSFRDLPNPNSARFDAEKNRTIGDDLNRAGREFINGLSTEQKALGAVAGALITGKAEVKVHF